MEVASSASTSASSKVRLVRCPQCGNLLPELPDFSVYQCGGCGAVLRAKTKGTLEDGMPEVSDVENNRGVSSKGGIDMGLGSVCETEVGSSGLETSRMNKDALSRNDDPISVLKRVDQCRGDNNACDRGDREHNSSNGDRVELGVPQCGDSGVGNEPKETRPSMESFRSGPVIDGRGGERKKFAESYGDASRQAARQVRFMDFPYSDEGPSKYGMGSYYAANERRKYYDGLDGFARVANLENDRAELLRKIDELKDQLSRTCDVGEKPKERIATEQRTAPIPSDPYGRHNMYLQGSFGANKQPLGGQGHRVGFPYIYDDQVSVPYNGRHGSMMQDSYPPPMHFRNVTLGYENAFIDEIIRKPPHRSYSHLTQMYHDQYPGPSDFTSDLFRSHPHESHFHHPTCSCLHCINLKREVPPPAAFGGRRSRNDPSNPILYQHKNSLAQGYTSEGSIHPNTKWLTRSSSDLNRENCGLGLQRHPRKVFIAHGSGKVCRTIAGGAPFILCYNCFELLKLPQKVGKDLNKIRCGACSSIILLELSSRGIALSAPTQIKQVLVDESIDMPNKRFRSSSGCISPSSNDYGDPNFKYEFPDTKVEPFPSCPKSTFCESGKRHGAHSLSSSFSEHEKSPGSSIARKEYSFSAELHIKDDESLLLPDSPLLHHNYLSSDDVADRCSKATKTKPTDQRIIDGWTSRHNSVKDACVATEIDIPLSEFVNGGVSQESTEVSKDEDRQNSKRGNESFIVGLFKRGFGELSKSGHNSENRRSSVFVNGQLIPGRVLRKAEKLAGPIQPGDYWYDTRAGFWGVMGHPCLGIILPNIEELNYPMPRNCAAGNTGVFVNGRELHEKDLYLLVSRGLPLTRNKSYQIEISGKIVDEQTGEELDGVGKLAPTEHGRCRKFLGFSVQLPCAESMAVAGSFWVSPCSFRAVDQILILNVVWML
nr:protein ENHANCED DISEASE RESISTANCE 4-like [Ipomoea batatas]